MGLKSLINKEDKAAMGGDDSSSGRHAPVRDDSGQSFQRWRLACSLLLSLALLWEIAARPILKSLWPDLELPQSVLKEISTLLMGLCGMGF